MAAPEPADDFNIPPPNDSATTPPAELNVEDGGFDPLPDPVIDTGVGQTELILGIAAILVLGGLLLFLRNAIRRSLIANRATIDSANAAAWTWYIVLLLFGALVIAGLIGGLFDSLPFVAIIAAVLVIGIPIAAMVTSRARKSG